MKSGARSTHSVTVDGLSAVRPDLQVRLLRRHEAGLQDGDVLAGGRVNFTALGKLLYERPETVPPALIYELAMLYKFKGKRHYALIQQHAASLECVPDDATPADLVALLLIYSPELVEQACVEATDTKGRRYTYFLPVDDKEITTPDLHEDTLRSLRQSLDADFAYRRRGEGARIYPTSGPWGFQLIIRRGDLYKRFGTVDAVSKETVHVGFRPETFDIVCFDAEPRKLRVSAGTGALRTAYAQLVGHHVFGHLRTFDEKGLKAAFTLDPLVAGGESSLSTAEVPGLIDARLTALDWSQGHSDPLSVKWRSSDLFISMNVLNHTLPRTAVPSRAQFQLSFASGDTSLVEVVVPNHIRIGGQHGQEIAIDWLYKRGFAQDLEKARAIVNLPLR